MTPESLTLAQAATEWGTAVPCAANLPADIGDPEFAWFIESGAVDLFLVERQGGVEQSAPQHMLRAGAGRLLPGTAPQDDVTSLGVIAKGLPGTTLRRLPVSRLGKIRNAELAEQVDAWLVDISAMLVRDVTHRPRTDAVLEAGEAPMMRKGTLAVRRGVVWITELLPHAGLFTGLIDPAQGETEPAASGCALPLTPDTWFSLTREVPISTASSVELADRKLLLPAVNAFNRIAFSLERLNRQLAVADQANLARERVIGRRSDEEDARRRLFDLYGVLDGDEGAEATDVTALYDALRAIGRHEGIAFQDGRPVALLPGLLGNYREIDPASRRKRRVTAARAATLRPNAWLFYAPLRGEVSGWRDLLRLAGKGWGADAARILLTGVLGGLITLLPAVAIGFVADEVIPVSDVGLLYGISVGLVAFGLVRALMRVLQGMTVMRFEGRATSRLESAFWDRLLRLPTRVLRRYPASDLAMRGMTFQRTRDAAQGVVGNGVLAIVFLSPAFLLIGLRDPMLGWLTGAFGLVPLVATVALGLRQIAPHRRRLRAASRLAGRLFQLINGISKLRVDGAEGSGFAVWARGYREQKRVELEVGAVEMHLRALGAALPLLAAAVLVLVLALSGPETVGVGDFIVIYVLFLLYQTAVVRLGESVSVLAGIVPAFNQIRPLLAETPETGADGQSVEMLGGDVAFDHVSFRYEADGPLILDDVSIQVRAGEFVAIAGESGAGKSTLFRLALGLERPSSGSVYYDDRDLQHLDLREVRRRIGVVPQHVRLHPQDLWDNVVGDHQGVTPDDAWRAIQLAAIDREIGAMPMGMLTPVGASAAVTSGGESQRIRLAHALIRDPRILLLDEATNWLDNETQSRVLANLASLTSTRIVIAHRVSTLRHADRIYVMQSGRIVQEGSFEELAATPGAFQDLVRRQVA